MMRFDLATAILLLFLCGLSVCLRNHRVSGGRGVGYFIIYSLALNGLVFQFLLLRKFISENEIISYEYNITSSDLRIPAKAAAVPAAALDTSSSHTRQPWSACLLLKDNNIILPEWLAYHYTILPLRRLIVALDPTSATDPRHILDQYRSIGMNISVWTDDDYWVNGLKQHERRNFVITNDTLPAYAQDHLVYRQKVFYRACLNQLKKEQRTWTAVIDADEYIAFNYLDDNSLEGIPSSCLPRYPFKGPPHRVPDQCKEHCSALNLTCTTRTHVLRDKRILYYCKNPDCANEYHRKSFRTRLNQSATVEELIARHYDPKFDQHDCIVLARYLFSSRDTSRKIIEKGMDKAFNATLFHTLRYRFRSELEKPQPGKSIVDVSRYDRRPIISPHRLHSKCFEGNAFPDNFKMSLRVHHYIGSWESFRLRGKELFKKRNYQDRWVIDNTTPQYTAAEGSRLWVSEFATLVGGEEKALELTERIRVREERELDKTLST